MRHKSMADVDIRIFMIHLFGKKKLKLKLNNAIRWSIGIIFKRKPRISYEYACAYRDYLRKHNHFAPFPPSIISPLIRRGDPRANAITPLINLDNSQRSRHVIVNAIICGATGKSWNNGRARDA